MGGGAAAARGSPGSAADEFDESDVWGSFGGADSGPAELARARTIPSSARASGRKKPLDHAHAGPGAVPGSLPMSIPDWQKLLGVEYRGHHAGEGELYGDDDDDYGKLGAGCRSGAVVPPHELAWRSRAASLSVHEGVGRTLKGRDLCRVRNAVLRQTGFLDLRI